jgi:RNA polymerase sigma-70 factor (ECF subfamily)
MIAPLMTTTPISLLERLRKPAPEAAWNRFVGLYTPLLYYWAHRLGLAGADAEDLVQDVFFVLLKELPHFTYEPPQRFHGWLRTILVNKWRERGRRAAAQPAGLRDNGATLVSPADAIKEFDEAEYRKYMVDRALQLMQTDFEPNTWKACWECVVAGRPTADVAAELGMTVPAVRLAKSRVLRRLRQELNGLLD